MKQELKRGQESEIAGKPPEPKEVTAIAVIQGQFKESREDLKSLFTEWLVMPTFLRNPETQRGFGARYGVSEQTLCHWKADPTVQKKVQKLVNVHALSRYADVMNGMISAAAKGNVLAQKLYFQYVMGWSEKVEHSGHVEIDANWTTTVGGAPIDRLPIPTRPEPDGTRVN